MKVTLTQDVVQNGTIKTSRRRNKGWIEGSSAQEFMWTIWTSGTEIEMSDESAKKYIEMGLAVAVDRSSE